MYCSPSETTGILIMLPHGPFSEVRTAGPFSRKARGARKVPTCLSLGELGGLCVSTEPLYENCRARFLGS
jgi:hypothetical protein